MKSNCAVRYFGVILLVVLSVALTVSAQTGPTHLERVLVPISVGSVPGAYGTVWSTELWYRNNSTENVTVWPLAIADWYPGIGLTVPLPIGNFPADAPGQIIFVGKNGGDKVQFDLRIFNRANPEDSWGTKIPVVREHEFRTTVSIINVPTAPDFRSALRIYALPTDEDPTEVVRVRIYSIYEDLLVDTELTLRGWPRYAGILSLTDTFPEIRQADRVWIAVEAVNPAAKIWAFVSVTSNHTQNVAIVTPN
jgi:hypothetical protein